MLQKMNRLKVEEKLKSIGLEVFTPREFGGIFKVSQNTASVFISSNIKSGLFTKLRNGFYSITDSHPAAFLVANKLYEPSYVSLDKALEYYNVIPETVYSITSITTKASRDFVTPKGNFVYQRIKKEVFIGYSLREVDGDKVFVADREKALADYLYFVDLKKRSLNDRLYLRDVKKDELIRWIELFDRPSLLALVDKIYVEYKKPRKIY